MVWLQKFHMCLSWRCQRLWTLLAQWGHWIQVAGGLGRILVWVCIKGSARDDVPDIYIMDRTKVKGILLPSFLASFLPSFLPSSLVWRVPHWPLNHSVFSPHFPKFKWEVSTCGNKSNVKLKFHRVSYSKNMWVRGSYFGLTSARWLQWFSGLRYGSGRAEKTSSLSGCLCVTRQWMHQV